MTEATMERVNGTERHAAVAAWQAAAGSGETLTGQQLGERFGRSARWGRERISEARQDRHPVPVAAAAVERHDSGEHQVTATVEAPRHPERRPWHDTVIVLAVAAVAAAASFGHMAHVAAIAGEPAWIAHVFPITIDGLVLAALRRGTAGRWWLALGLVASVGANTLAQYPDLAAQAGPVVSAWPPLALYGTHRLLHR